MTCNDCNNYLSLGYLKDLIYSEVTVKLRFPIGFGTVSFKNKLQGIFANVDFYKV